MESNQLHLINVTNSIYIKSSHNYLVEPTKLWCNPTNFEETKKAFQALIKVFDNIDVIKNTYYKQDNEKYGAIGECFVLQQEMNKGEFHSILIEYDYENGYECSAFHQILNNKISSTLDFLMVEKEICSALLFKESTNHKFVFCDFEKSFNVILKIENLTEQDKYAPECFLSLKNALKNYIGLDLDIILM